MNPPRYTRPLLAAAGLVLAQAQAMAHEGHGLPGTHHWHAEDALLWLALAVAALGVAWFFRRK